MAEAAASFGVEDIGIMLRSRPQQDGIVNQPTWLLNEDTNPQSPSAWTSSQKTKTKIENKVRESLEEKNSAYGAVNQANELDWVDENVSVNAKEAHDVGSYLAKNPVMHLSIGDEAGTGHNRSVRKANDTLNLSNRQLKRLPDSFGSITSLKTLNLSKNQLEAIPDSISAFVNLVVLDLHSNHLNALPDCIGMLSKLKILNVSGNQLKCFPDNIGNCSALLELDASFNQLESLPANFGSTFLNLQRLSLQLNRLSALPSSLCEMKSLKHLEVQFNKLISLPASLGNLTNLEILNASSNFNNLAGLPDSIGDLVSLRSLDLSYNQIRQLPASLGKLQTLETLRLDGNPLAIPPAQVVEHSHEAVMEYMAEQWKNSVLSGNARKIITSGAKSDFSLPSMRTSWMTGLLHGMCGFPSMFRGSKSKSLGWREYHSSDRYVQFSG
ncbi:hypothetical protein O6H91_12G092600 [Diphasiastrum complanatum]|uniref:Uncharacterized protein n=1 Tax=Diphasiastrum complanatum TaxID=34168 RepID=A0ACC2C4V3_DIPCM|nr:hypothetical protein O6H91_12G092600 [Diphasiastrum complanatum]